MCMSDNGDPKWDKELYAEATRLIDLWTEESVPFTSLLFKETLRDKTKESKLKIYQEDVGKFLRHWYLKRDGKKTHTHKEHRLNGRLAYYEYIPNKKKLTEKTDKLVKSVTGKPSMSAADKSTGKSVDKRLLNRLEKLASEDPVNVTTKRYQDALKDAVKALKDV